MSPINMFTSGQNMLEYAQGAAASDRPMTRTIPSITFIRKLERSADMSELTFNPRPEIQFTKVPNTILIN